eukprot:CAMPEP_0113435340 /NCGR_PEP_ID=MMETSP0013_2-20120614/36222_1 /TAXON_ID=2843 ORGANISM="Skeletonema costatum, Strain 1716" /NCGR_SAMPLE_ID=MMETSP0013_2 /ASSEMBLY_ACC=CAM_ASM_000158 /LENGTH=766 /DNA_ID=CAMNT_0000325705 /DNA_START=128 /DNA_END=2428 /DNA_ORIENTATION=- /assembly_acc=CAM_ASM_000158
MEVIPLDDRVRSTTVLNTAAPSDFTTVYHDNYEIDADALAEDDLAADAAANEGMWTRRNKLLLSLIGGSALLCAIATGSGVAAHRARVANLNSCPAGMVPNVGATPDHFDPTTPASGKSSKGPTAKSSKSTSGPPPTLPPPTVRALTGATVPATVNEEEVSVGGAYYPSVPKTVEDKRKNRMLVEHLGQRDASSTLSWKLKDALEEMMPNFLGSDEEKQQQRLNYARRLEDGDGGPTPGPTKSSKSPSTKSSKSPTAKSSKSSGGGGSSIVEGLKPSTDNCKCVNSGLNTSSSNGNGGGSGAKSSKSPTSKTGKSTRVPVPQPIVPVPQPIVPVPPPTKSSKSPTAKSSKASTPGDGTLTSPLAPTACNAPVAPLRPTNPMAPGGKSSKSPTSKTGKSTRVPVPQPIVPVPPAIKPPTASVIPPPATTETKSPTPCTVDCPGVPVVDPTPGGGGGDKTPSPTRGGEGENPSVPEPTPPTPGTEDLTPPVPTPSTPGTPDGGPTPSTPTPNCDNDAVWSSEDGKTCDDVADGDANVLCVTASSVDGTSASVACPAACNTECLTNCDNDEAWESTDGESCAVVAGDPIGLCKSAVNGSGESATTACPASCNKECFVNCDNDPLWIGVQEDETCDDVAENTKGLCERFDSNDVAASEACPAACNPECFPPTIDVPVTFPTGFPKLDSYVPTPEITVGVTVTVGEEDKTPPTPTPSRVVIQPVTPMPTNIGTSIGSSVGSSGGTITVSTETTGPPTLAREDEQGDDEEVR